MHPDEISSSRETLFRKRQSLAHALFRGEEVPDFREKYLACRDREALLDYEDLKAHNLAHPEARTFDRPRKTTPQNRRLRIWLNFLMIAMVLAVVFFSVITPRLTPTPMNPVGELYDARPPGEMFP